MGVYGENSHFLSDPTEKKIPGYNTLTHIMKVSARNNNNKKVIAKKPLTNLYEMNSRLSHSIFLLQSM